MATKKTDKSFLTNSIKEDIKQIVSDVINGDKKLTANDIEAITIKRTDNGYVVEYNDGSSSELPSVEVIQTDEMDGSEDADMYREGLLSLLYTVALWSGYEYDPKGENNLNIDFSLVGDEIEDNVNDDVEEETFQPPTKEQVLAAAMGEVEEESPTDDDSEELVDDGVIEYEDELSDGEYVAGEDYSGTEEDVDGYEDDDEGYNEDFVEEDEDEN